MKKTFLILIAAFAAASFTQAAEVEQRTAPRYTISQERLDFMVKRLGSVAAEEIAKSAPKSARNSSLANSERVQTQRTSAQPASKPARASS